MARVSVQQLKDNLGVTDLQLALVCSDDHLKKLADHIEDFQQYAYALNLKGWQLTELNTNSSLTYVMKTQAALGQWKKNDPLKVTYLNLLKAILDLGEGVVAVKLCELCKERRGDDPNDQLLAAATAPHVSEREEGTLRQLKDHFQLTDSQLSQPITDAHLEKIADQIENYKSFADKLGLKGWRVTEIATDPNLNYLLRTLAVLKQWQKDHPLEATYLNLVKVSLVLNEGMIASKICDLCRAECQQNGAECDTTAQ